MTWRLCQETSADSMLSPPVLFFHTRNYQDCFAKMLGLGWITLKQAHDALRSGRLDDVHRLLDLPQVKAHKRAWELRQQLTQAYVERGEKHLRRDDPSAAWADLLKAEQLEVNENITSRLRHALTRLGLAEVRALLETGEPGRAVEAIKQLREKGVRHPELGSLEEGSKEWNTARQCLEHGEFHQAALAVERASRLLGPSVQALQSFKQMLDQQQKAFAPILLNLHRAAQSEQWQRVLELSEQLLAIAPQHDEVRKLRTRAWKAIEPATIVSPTIERIPQAAPDKTERKLQRYILWIDGVGGFLLCLGNKLTLGQACAGSDVDIPLVADVSRRHATLTRDTEGYILEGERAVSMNNKLVDRVLLSSGDRFTLGSACQLLFRQEVAISTSARLDVVSGLRFGLSVDGVLMMAETLILGPGNQVHVSMPDLDQPVILYRNKEEIGIKASGTIIMNGQSFRERVILEPGRPAHGNNFSLTLDPIS